MDFPSRLPCKTLTFYTFQSSKTASDFNVYIDYTLEASALGGRRVYHYHVVHNASKDIEPH